MSLRADMPIEKQITINSVGNIVLYFAQWLISVLLVRLGGFADAGVFSLAMTIANVFAAVANCGMRDYLLSDREGRFGQKYYLYARLGMCALSMVCCGLYLLADRSYTDYHRWAVGLYLLYLDLNLLADVMYGALQLEGRLYLNGLSSVMKGGLCLAVFLASYALGHSLLLSLGLMAAADGLIVVFFDLRNYRPRDRGALSAGEGLRQAVRIVRRCIPLMCSYILPLVITAVPRRSIQAVWGEDALGYYASLFTPAVVITVLMPTIVQGILPSLSESWQRREKRGFLGRTAGLLGAIVAVTLAAELCAAIAGRPVMKLVFGEEILPYFTLLYAAIAVTGVNAMKSCTESVLICMRRMKTLVATSVMELLVVLALTDGLVRSQGVWGAAWVALIGYGVHLLFNLAIVIRESAKHFKRGGER